MKNSVSRGEAKEKIKIIFTDKNFTSEDVRKVKLLAMKFNIKLGDYRKLYCRECLSKLKGKTRVAKDFKIVNCGNCGATNRHKY